MKRFLSILSVLVVAVMLWNCASTITHQVAYPPADDLFVTVGDDPGSESPKPYIPKGQFIHVSTEYYLPIPILGMITFGNAEPQFVFQTQVLPKVRQMGGDALIGARVSYTPPPSLFLRFLGLGAFLPPAQTIIVGQVVKR